MFLQKKRDATDNLNLRGFLLQHPAHFFLPHCRACDLAIGYFILTIKWLSTFEVSECIHCQLLSMPLLTTDRLAMNLQSVCRSTISNDIQPVTVNIQEYYDQ